jgi:hypothetical protein
LCRIEVYDLLGSMKPSSSGLFAITVAAFGQVKFTKSGQVALRSTASRSPRLFWSRYAKPYLHPLSTATGKAVTRMWPMAEKEGEARDHPHHRGLWFTHGDVNKIDFGRTDQRAADDGHEERQGGAEETRLGQGDKQGRVEASFEWLDDTGKALLPEDRVMTFHSDPKLRTIDFDVGSPA